MCPLPAYWVPLILRLSVSNVGLAAIAIRYTIWFSKALNALAPGMIDRLTCCLEPKHFLEAGVFCVEALVHGAEVVLVLQTFKCSPWCLYTPMPKDWNGAFFSVEDFCCLAVCWVMPSRVLVFVYLSEICLVLVWSSGVILLLVVLLVWGFYINWIFVRTFICF